VWGGGTVSSSSDGNLIANYVQLNPSFNLANLSTVSSLTVGGNLTVTGTGGNVTTKVTGYVNAGTFLTLDNVKATVTTSSNRGLSLGAVSTTFTANIGGVYGLSAGNGGGASLHTLSVTTTASSSIFNWNFVAEGDMPIYTVNDITNSRVYRITIMIGNSYNNNFICIERLM
jgi:hypothetical protein